MWQKAQSLSLDISKYGKQHLTLYQIRFCHNGTDTLRTKIPEKFQESAYLKRKSILTKSFTCQCMSVKRKTNAKTFIFIWMMIGLFCLNGSWVKIIKKMEVGLINLRIEICKVLAVFLPWLFTDILIRNKRNIIR